MPPTQNALRNIFKSLFKFLISSNGTLSNSLRPHPGHTSPITPTYPQTGVRHKEKPVYSGHLQEAGRLLKGLSVRGDKGK